MFEHRALIVAGRAVAIWMLIFVVEVVHGVLRTLWLVPLVGDFAARRIGVPVGAALIFVIAWTCIRWIGARSHAALAAVGLTWLTLMLVAEFAVARILGFDVSAVAQDLDPTRGGLLAFGMAFLAVSPWLAFKLKSRRANT